MIHHRLKHSERLFEIQRVFFLIQQFKYICRKIVFAEKIMNLKIRPATISDLENILQIYAETLDNGTVLSVEKAKVIFLKQTQYPDYQVFVTELNDRIVGTFALLIMENMAHLGTPSAVVEDVGVLPEMQGKGIGKAMMEFALQYAKEKGCYKMSFSSNLRREKAHQFYESLGFKKHGFSFLMELI
jgi:GNAT superfamily N-acetyltransferase